MAIVFSWFTTIHLHCSAFVSVCILNIIYAEMSSETMHNAYIHHTALIEWMNEWNQVKFENSNWSNGTFNSCEQEFMPNYFI